MRADTIGPSGDAVILNGSVTNIMVSYPSATSTSALTTELTAFKAFSPTYVGSGAPQHVRRARGVQL